MDEQDKERWKTLSEDMERLRGVEQENAELKVKLARAHARIRLLEGAPTLPAPPVTKTRQKSANGKSNGKAHG
jgi:hypothetical protein